MVLKETAADTNTSSKRYRQEYLMWSRSLVNIKRRALKRAAKDEKRCRITENIVELRDADIGRGGSLYLY